ncbi:hypothetical protein IMY05_C4590000700 [Salix suchowensis]|nr:hypothetical protein IMY05_C4590000700 [Salix suchowensis]
MDFEDIDKPLDRDFSTSISAPMAAAKDDLLSRSSSARRSRTSSPRGPNLSPPRSHEVADEAAQNEIQRLRSKCAAMESMRGEAVESVAHAHKQLRTLYMSIESLRKQNQSLERALEKVIQEKNDVQAVVLSHRSTEQAAERLFEVGPTGIPISALTTFLVQELGYWADISSTLSGTLVNPDDSVVLPSGSIDIAREKSHERIEFIQRWMAAMLPSLGTAMNTELMSGVALDPMERLETILDAVGAVKTKLQQERDAKQSISKEADERKRMAIIELRLLQEQEERVAAESAALHQKKLKLMELVNANSSSISSQPSTRRTSRRTTPLSPNPPEAETTTPHHPDAMDASFSTQSRSQSRLLTLDTETVQPSTSASPSRSTRAPPTLTLQLP